MPCRERCVALGQRRLSQGLVGFANTREILVYLSKQGQAFFVKPPRELIFSPELRDMPQMVERPADTLNVLHLPVERQGFRKQCSRLRAVTLHHRHLAQTD